MFGELGDFPLPEIFSMLDKYSGRLLLEHLEDGQHYELYLMHGQWWSLAISGRQIQDVAEAKRTFAGLIRASAGTFAFQPRPEAQIPRHFNLHLTPLLLSTTVEMDECQQYQAQLPHPDTRFMLVQTDRYALPTDLRTFMDRAEAFLRPGCSVAELARNLALGLPEVQLKLFKLRQGGFIEPQRTPPNQASIEPRPAGLFSRLLNALRGKRNQAVPT